MDGVSNNMSKLLHAHELMDFILEYPNKMTETNLKYEVEKRFGDVNFTSCSNNFFTFDEILLFLFERNKIEYIDDKIKVLTEYRCDHD